MPSFQYSLNASTIKTTPIFRQIEVAAKAGYTGIELWHDDIDDYLSNGGGIKDIRKCVEDHGLKVPMTIYMKDWFQPAGEPHIAAMEDARRKLEQASQLGAPHAVAGPPGDRADRTLGKKHYHELLELGAEFGVRPAFEYLGFVDDIKTVDDAIEIITGAAHPAACLVVDPFHCHIGEGGMESIAKLSAEQVAVSHFNDAPGGAPPHTQRDPDRVMPGDGIIDLKRYCDLLRQIGYQGFLSLELFSTELWKLDPLEVAAQGLEKMKAAAEA